MPFSAINTFEEEVRQRNERHTLEIQLEQAMSVYQQALEAQHLEHWEDARRSYEKLFAFDVMRSKPSLKRSAGDADSSTGFNGTLTAPLKNAKTSQMGPALRLRAMALKNYAILLASPEFATPENIERALAFFGEALDLVGVEDKEKLIVGSLAQLFWALGSRRGARLGLEMIVQNDDGGTIVPLEIWTRDRAKAARMLSPTTLKWLEALEYVTQTAGQPQESTPAILRPFTHLKAAEAPMISVLEQESTATISLRTKTWAGLISGVHDALSQHSRRYKRKGAKDSYMWSTRDLWSVKFTGILLNREQRTPGPDLEVESDNLDMREKHTPEKVDSEAPPQQPSTPSAPSVLASPGEHPASPAKRRRTERITRSASLALPADFGLTDTNFVSQFNGFLSLSSAKCPEFMSPAYLFFEPAQDVPAQLMKAADLKDLLTTWDSRESAQFLTESTSLKPQKGGIMTTLRKDNGRGVEDSSDLQDEDSDLGDLSDSESLAVDQFVASYDGCHIQQIRLELASALLRQLAVGGCTRSFAKVVFNFVDEIEGLLWARRRFFKPDEALALFALYSDRWLLSREEDLKVKASRWQVVSGSTGGLPHTWVLAFTSQEAPDAIPESSIARFEDIGAVDFEDEPSRFSYLTQIPALTHANVQMQISKFKAAAAFERVMSPADSGGQQDEEDIKLLEAMLMPQTHVKPDGTSAMEFEAIQQFLHFAQPQFKMGLWYILLEKYEMIGDTEKCLTGLTRIFAAAMSAVEQGEPLLQSLCVAHDVGTRLIPLFERNPHILEKSVSLSETNEVMRHIVNLLQTLQLFMLYDDAVNSNLLQKPVTPTWTDVLAKFRELVTLWWSIFYHYWLQSVPDQVKAASETVNDILSIIHERLGNLGYCGLVGGCLLRLHCSEIIRINWDGSALDLTQCLRCRYGLTLTLYGEGSNHHTVPQPLKYDEALDLLPYVMRMILSRRNFNQVVMRTDTRSVVDEFANVIGGEARRKYHHKRELLENYLMGDFTPQILQRTWDGIESSHAHLAAGDSNGLWFIQAYVLLNQYRMRRRQAYSASSARTDNLESAAKLFVDDISASPYRFESWAGLAQSYAYLCEDTLTFGAEIVTPEDAAGYCRKGLLAAVRALAIKLRGDTGTILQLEVHESMSSGLLALIGNMLVLGAIPPLSLAPFVLKKPPRPFLVEVSEANKHRIAIKPQKQIQTHLAMAVAAKCLSSASDPQSDWINAVTRTMAAKEAGEEPHRVLILAEKALSLQPASHLDAQCIIIELIWTYYRQGQISAELAQSRLLGLDLGGQPSQSVQELTEASFRELLERDKWLHRPRYALAKMYENDLRNTIKAQNELQQLFSLKSPTKPLVIWKMESELPGQHGVDMNRYLCYLGDLMAVNEDSVGIALLARRFRKTGMEMWNHTQAYEHIFTRACVLTRKLLGFEMGTDVKLSDRLMADVVAAGPEKFDAVTKGMDASEGYTEDNEQVQALYYTTELRRLSSGISAGAMADDLVVTLFLLMHREFVEKHPDLESAHHQGAAVPTPTTQENAEQPQIPDQSTTTDSKNTPRPSTQKSASKKKLLRKDVINAALQLLKPLQAKLSKMDEIGLTKNLKLKIP